MKFSTSSALTALLVVGAIAAQPTITRAQGIDPRCPGVTLQDRAAQDA
jgi:hypothetical protein